MTTADRAAAASGADAVVYLEGGFVAGPLARVSVFDHGFAFGDGVFETIRVDAGVPRFLAQHLDRLKTSLDELLIEHPSELLHFDDLILSGIGQAGLKDAYVKAIVTRGSGELSPSACGPPTFVMIVRPLRLPPGRRYKSGVATVSLWADQPGGRPGQSHKSLSYMRSVLARHEIETTGAFEGFFTDAAGSLLEGSVSNVFAYSGGRLVTPPAGLCLPGVIRAQVLTAADLMGTPVELRPIERAAVTEATEVFLTNSLVGVMPVRTVDDAEMPRAPGPVTSALSAAVEKAAISIE